MDSSCKNPSVAGVEAPEVGPGLAPKSRGQVLRLRNYYKYDQGSVFLSL